MTDEQLKYWENKVIEETDPNQVAQEPKVPEETKEVELK
jgi:hypothetical protein